MEIIDILNEILERYPTDLQSEKNFLIQFTSWDNVNQYGNIDPIELKLEQISVGSDRIVYQTKHPDIILKAAFGPQIMLVPPDLDYLYLPVFEFEFPVPLQDPDFYGEGRTHGQLQLKIEQYHHYRAQYLETREKQIRVQNTGCSVSFAKAILKEYGEEVLEDFIQSLETERKMRGPSDSNWGYLDGKPIIYDYGRINERWNIVEEEEDYDHDHDHDHEEVGVIDAN